MDSRMLSLHADYAIREIDSADILLLPGGGATPAQMQDQEVLAWVRRIHEKSKWTISACTGSLILAAAGLLKGLEATTHWAAMDTLAMFGAKPARRRVVRQGIFTSKPDLAGALRDELGQHAINSQRGEQQRYTGEGREQDHSHLPLLRLFAQQFSHRRNHGDRLIGVNRVNLSTDGGDRIGENLLWNDLADLQPVGFEKIRLS